MASSVPDWEFNSKDVLKQSWAGLLITPFETKTAPICENDFTKQPFCEVFEGQHLSSETVEIQRAEQELKGC